MNRILTATLTVSLALSGGVVLAQTGTAPNAATSPAAATPAQHLHHAPNPQHEIKHLTKQLHLTADQASRLEPILADRDQKMAAIRANDALTPTDIHQQLRAIHKSTEEQFAGILTPDQLQQMKSMHRKHDGPETQTAPPTA